MSQILKYDTAESLKRPEFRQKINALLLKFEADFYEKVEHAQKMLDANGFNLALYKRLNVETILRINLRRAIDPMIASYWATRDPQLCKEWGLYGAEEGRHDRMFARDLHDVGMTDEEIYGTTPTFATQLLNGYFYFTLATEGPLATMVSAFYLEYVAGKTQPGWLDEIEKHLGTEKTKGARAHLVQDIEESHIDWAWNTVMRAVKTDQDEENFIRHLSKINALIVSTFVEIAEITLRQQAGQEEYAVKVPVSAVGLELLSA